MQIRAARPADAPAVRRAVAAAFGAQAAEHGTQVAELWDAVEAAGHVQASLVAEADGELVGHVGVSHAWLDARRALVDVAVLAPLSVHPDAQRGGIGTALVAAGDDHGPRRSRHVKPVGTRTIHAAVRAAYQYEIRAGDRRQHVSDLRRCEVSTGAERLPDTAPRAD